MRYHVKMDKLLQKEAKVTKVPDDTYGERERERERVRLMWVFATICGFLLRRLVFATVANTEGGYLSRKGRYLPPQHTRILSICYSCNYVTTRICILSRFSMGGYLLQ